MINLCSINNYDQINKLHLARRSIYGVNKTAEYMSHYPTIVRSILRNLKQDHHILGNWQDDQLVSYAIVWMPNNLPWWFCKHIETIKPKSITSIQQDILPPIFDLMGGIIERGDQAGKHQGFFAFPVEAFRGIFKFKNTYEPFRSRDFKLFSTVDRNWILRTQIEVALLNKPLIPKIKTMGVYEVSLKEEFRTNLFDIKG